MEHLIGNGTHLYRRSVNNTYHLVRTPITISLQPSDRAWYSCAQNFSNNWPASGFLLTPINRANITEVGYNCSYAWLHPSSLMYWRPVTAASQHDPETVWYQGAYATSASTRTIAQRTCESYQQVGAYKFTIPSGLASLTVHSVKVKFTNGGGIECFGPSYLQSGLNKPLSTSTVGDWSAYNCPFYVTESLLPPQQIEATKPYDASVNLLADVGDCRGVKNLWEMNSTSKDGMIPMLAQPVSKEYTMGSTTRNFINANREFWITPIVGAEIPSSLRPGEPYAPMYVNDAIGPTGTMGWWACISLWGITIEVSLGG